MAAKHETPEPPEKREGRFADWYEEWRRAVDPNDLSTDQDDPFANLRDKSPGREPDPSIFGAMEEAPSPSAVLAGLLARHFSGEWRFAAGEILKPGPEQVFCPTLSARRQDRGDDSPPDAQVRRGPDWVCDFVSTADEGRATWTRMQTYRTAKVPHVWLVDTREEFLMVHRWTPDGYLNSLGAMRGEKVRAEPFGSLEISIGVLFGDDNE